MHNLMKHEVIHSPNTQKNVANSTYNFNQVENGLCSS
jgi:hypothetical protein